MALVIGIIVIAIIEFLPKRESPEKKKIEKIIEKINDEDDSKDNKLDYVKQLYKENNDLVGYLIIPGTNINYPVMYTKGKDYYLRRGFDKKRLVNGSLFIDKYNTVNPRDENLIIYGHNMTTDKTMFYDLEKYRDKEFYLSHKEFMYYTLDAEEKYEIIAVFISQVYKVKDDVFKYYKYYNSQTKEEFDDYIKNIRKLSLYKIDNTTKYGDKFLTLSTCEYSKENSRFVVVARKI